MRHFLISALLLSLISGCTGGYIATHRIDVQQGNALDQESVARLKPGLNRSQVRFLLGTPLVVDPFRTDRWDYVYLYYTAGKLTEQKRISLFFEGDTLVRIEGDVPEPTAPQPAPAPEPQVNTAPTSAPLAAEALPDSASLAPQAVPIAAASLQQETVGVPAAKPASATVTAPAATAALTPGIAAPLPRPKEAPASVDRHPAATLSLQPETDVAAIRPDVMPAFPDSRSAAGSDAPVLKALNAWANAWKQRDEEAYLAAYDASFVPQDGGSRADWEKHRRLLLGLAKNIDLRIEAPAVERLPDGGALVTFNQFYRTDNYFDAVVKQLRMVERDEGWMIAEERVLSVLRSAQP